MSSLLAAESAPDKRGRKYVSVHVIFISWACDQQTKLIDDINKVREAAKSFGPGWGALGSNIFHEISATPNQDRFNYDWDTTLKAVNAQGNLVVVVYLGGVIFLGDPSTCQPPFAHIRSLGSTGFWGWERKFIQWDMRQFHDAKADILFITNFTSREFLRCLLSCRSTPFRSQHHLELLTFNSNSSKRFARYLSKLNDIQCSLGNYSPLGYSTGSLCEVFNDPSPGEDRSPYRDSLLELENRGARKTAVDLSFEMQFSEYVRHDILSGTENIWLACRHYPIFSLKHAKLPSSDFTKQFRKATKLRIPPTGSRAIIWKMSLDYQSNIMDPGTSSTICVAVKQFLPADTTQERIFRNTFNEEKENLIQMTQWPHSNILPFLGSFEMPEDFSYVSFGLIFPFALGGNLFDFMRLTKEEHQDLSLPYPQSPLRCFKYGCWEHGVLAECLGLISALSHIHHRIDGKIIIHRDIKPSNILIDNGKFKLADFGASRIKSSATSSKTEWWKGTEAYSPPELFLPNADGSSSQFGRARDVWGLGCVFFEVLVMLASLHYDQIPSVQEFQDVRRKASEDRGDKYSTDMFAKNMECVEALANMISHLNDPHITWLLEPTINMLATDYSERPQALAMEEWMVRSYAALNSQIHHDPYYGPLPNETITRELYAFESTELAHFWFRSFWHDNYRRFYIWWPTLALPYLAAGTVIGLFIFFWRLFEKLFWSKIESVGLLFVYIFSPLIGGMVTGLILDWFTSSVIPSLVLWVFKRQARAYMAPVVQAEITTNNEQAENVTGSSIFTETDSGYGTAENNALLNSASHTEYTVLESIRANSDDDALQIQQRDQPEDRRSSLRKDFERGSKAGKAFVAWVQARVVRPMWSSLIFTQKLIDNVANTSKRMSNERRQNANQGLRSGRAGPIAL